MINTKVDELFGNASQWKNEMMALRDIVVSCNLNEEFKWKQACYTFNTKNILIISSFKNFCALNFFKGALIKDTDSLLVQAGENSHSARQIRFTSIEEIIKKEPILKSYIYQAIEIEKSGLKIAQKKVEEYMVPEELEKAFRKNPNFESAFYSLTPGRQKMYLMYFSQAKQSQTRSNRIEKYMPRILNGYGFNDCVCGLSKKKPICDGSHKQLKSDYMNL